MIFFNCAVSLWCASVLMPSPEPGEKRRAQATPHCGVGLPSSAAHLSRHARRHLRTPPRTAVTRRSGRTSTTEKMRAERKGGKKDKKKEREKKKRPKKKERRKKTKEKQNEDRTSETRRNNEKRGAGAERRGRTWNRMESRAEPPGLLHHHQPPRLER